VLLLLGCAHSPGEGGAFCQQVDGNRTLQVELMFGREIAGHGRVSDAQWSDFLRDEVTPRFPAGLTDRADL